MLHAAATLDKSVTGCIENCDRVSRPCSMVTRPHTADNAAPLQHCSTCQYHSSYSEDLFLGWKCGGSEGSVAKVCEVLVKIN